MPERKESRPDLTFGAIVGLVRGLQTVSLPYEKSPDVLALQPDTTYFTTLPENIQIITERISIVDLVNELRNTSPDRELLENNIQANNNLKKMRIIKSAQLLTSNELQFLSDFGTEQFHLHIIDLKYQQEWRFATKGFLNRPNQNPIIVPENSRLINPRVLRNVYYNAQNSYLRNQEQNGYSPQSSMAAKSL